MLIRTTLLIIIINLIHQIMVINMTILMVIYYILKVHDGLTRKKRYMLEIFKKIRNIRPLIYYLIKPQPTDYLLIIELQ